MEICYRFERTHLSQEDFALSTADEGITVHQIKNATAYVRGHPEEYQDYQVHRRKTRR